MCRLLAYLGLPICLEPLLYQPEHSLIVQSYQPREMLSGVVNADGFGVGWYHPHKDTEPFVYKNTLPIWNDTNLPNISRYVETGCTIAYIRSAIPGQVVDFSNSQPFQYERLLFIHNGGIGKFQQTLYRPIRNQLDDRVYHWIRGTTDSEHIFALVLNQWLTNPGKTIEQALHKTLVELAELAQKYQTYVSANVVISDGTRLIASRFSTKSPAPSLYWLRDDPTFPKSVIIASEPLFPGNWISFSENSIFSVGKDCDIKMEPI
ncbi:MAG: ergothioneine biosynthesis protein EgtC [Scytonema sp. PMC 1069.18]|nr:ergothioneine biosynthesis protein EgtC [Scytonema sp. PMC 1069.18]MEC4885301.1 ergothioneine biosynthesis protein EgtC [Scytonema sp. PMC 1070.18]